MFQRIVIAAPGFGGADGAAELTRQWAEGLAGCAGRSGARIEAWSLTDAARPAALPRRVGFATAAGRRWRFAAMALQDRAAGPATLCVAMHVHLLPALLPLMWRGASVVTVMLGIEVWKPLRPLERAALRRSWRVSAISAHTLDRFRRENPALADIPVSVCHPRVSDPVVPQDRVTPGPYALIVGRMSACERYKGHDVLIDAWPAVLEAAPAATLIVAGGGDDRERLERRVAAAGLTGRIVFAGPVDAERLAALYRDAAFFVMPSSGEGFGIVYLEAMRAGKPCLAAPGAAAEIITDGVDGLLVDPGDCDGLAAAAARLFTDDVLRRRLGGAASARVAHSFTPERFAARLSDLISTPC